MRINKYIAASGIASRRKADELIAAGRVCVNGAVMTSPGCDIAQGDLVTVDGKPVRALEKTYWYALNKPAGCVTTASDDKGRPTVMQLLTDVEVRVFPVGRLDYDTSGLLLLTNDGDLASRIADPRRKIKKTYMAKIGGKLTPQQLSALRSGIEIELPVGSAEKGSFRKYKTKPAEVNIISENASQSLVEITISEGKNRQVRRMFAAAGHRVLQLERTAIGSVRLGRTRPGTYRKLTEAEIESLKNC